MYSLCYIIYINAFILTNLKWSMKTESMSSMPVPLAKFTCYAETYSEHLHDK